MQYEEKPRQVRTLFTPSLLSMMIGLMLSLFIVGYVLYMTVFVGSQAETFSQLALIKTQYVPSGAPPQVESVVEAVNQSEFAANSAVFLVWAATGALLYVLASVFIHALKVGEGALETVQYSSKNDKLLVVEEMVTRTALRIFGIAGFFAMYKLLLIAFPYILVWLTSIQRASDALGIFLAAVSMFLLGMFLVYAVMLLLRLITLRTRVFF